MKASLMYLIGHICSRTFRGDENGETVTAMMYCSQLQRIHESLLKSRPVLPNRWEVLLLYDNTRPHVAKKTQMKLIKFDREVLPHPPYSPDIAPSDYHLFRAMDNFMQNKEFRNGDELKQEVDKFLTSRNRQFWEAGIDSLTDG
jgi:[histone H3]-lysine36 N-dimethyltransferase SETMAR